MFVLERKTWKIIKFAVTRAGSSKYQFIFPLSYATPATLMEITTPGEKPLQAIAIMGRERQTGSPVCAENTN
jgi:hypothetical protein